MSTKKRQKGNHPVKTSPPKQGAWSKKLRSEMKRVNKHPTIKRGR